MQADYRNNPSYGGVDTQDIKIGTYDQPNSPAAIFTSPYPDQTIKSYDLPTDATDFGYLRDPFTDAALKANPITDAQGFSPDLDAQLAWERAGPDGSPP